MYAIETEKLSKKYEDKVVVNEVNFKVSKGEIFGFLGSNGAGKSTFINMLTGIIYPSSGSFKLLGHHQNEIDRVKGKIGVLPEYSTLYDDLTPLQHLNYFCRIMKKNKSTKEYLDVLEKVGLGEAKNMKVGKFSFGMKKKLGIAQAIVHDPEMIILDEPTSGVDADSIINIHALIKHLNGSGKTVFITSHNMDEVEKLCTEIAIMKSGQIISQGTMDELRKQHASTYLVTINHSHIDRKQCEHIKSIIDSVANKLVMKQNHFVVEVHKEQDISLIVRTLVQSDIDVYAVESEKPSLEEIFLHTNRKSTA